MSQKKAKLIFSNDSNRSTPETRSSKKQVQSLSLPKKPRPSLNFQKILPLNHNDSSLLPASTSNSLKASKTVNIKDKRARDSPGNKKNKKIKHRVVDSDDEAKIDAFGSSFSSEKELIDLLSSDDFEYSATPKSFDITPKVKREPQRNNPTPLVLDSYSVRRASQQNIKICENDIHASFANKGVWWADLVPENRDQLAVHKKKIDQVFDWLDKAINFPQIYRNNRILALLGPAGSGKTATLTTLAKELNCEVLEWVNPLLDYAKYERSPLDLNIGEIRTSQQFSYFLQQAKRYSQLELVSSSHQKEAIHQSASQDTNKILGKSAKNKIILVEDLPNINNRQTKLGFLNSIYSFLALPAESSCPLVIIFSDTGSADQLNAELDHNKRHYSNGLSFTSGSNDSDKFQGSQDISSIYNVLPKDILDSPYCQKIQFNSVANTILLKLLTRTVLVKGSQVISSLEKSSNLPKPQLRLSARAETQLKQLAELSIGDIRASLNNLQLIWSEINILCSGSCKDAAKTPSPQHSTSISKSTHSLSQQYPPSNGSANTTIKRNLLKPSKSSPVFIVTGFSSTANSFLNEGSSADHNLNLFHALGKVLYAKRAPGSENRGKLESDPNTILKKLSVDFDMFSLYLHQNFPLFTESVEEYAQISEFFSECDLINQAGAVNPQFRNFSSSISGILSVRSLMELRQNVPKNIKLFEQKNHHNSHSNKSPLQVGSSKLFSIQKPEIFNVIKNQNIAQKELSLACANLKAYGHSYLHSIHYISKIYAKRSNPPPFLSHADFNRIKSLVSFVPNSIESYLDHTSKEPSSSSSIFGGSYKLDKSIGSDIAANGEDLSDEIESDSE